MKIFLRLILCAAVISLCVWLWTVFFPAPEKVIRHRLAKLAEDVSFESDQGSLSRLAGGESVAGFFQRMLRSPSMCPDKNRPHSPAARKSPRPLSVLAKKLNLYQ
jgi:hypothetical protein